MGFYEPDYVNMNDEQYFKEKDMENLAKAVIAVMKSVKGMEKNSKVGTGNSSYDGTKDQDVKEIFNEELAKNGLCILPIDIAESTEISRWEEKNQYGTKQKQSVFTTVKVKYLLLHESGESVNLAGYGQGVDSQDKGAGKATTYALKNCLLYTFLTPVGKMPDTELSHSDDIETPPMIKTLPLLTKELETAMLKAISNGDSATVLVRLKKYKYSSNQEYRINDAINTYAAFIAKTEGGK